MSPPINLPKLVADIYRAVADLEKLYPGGKFTPDGHLVGSIGEVIAECRPFSADPVGGFRGRAYRDAERFQHDQS